MIDYSDSLIRISKLRRLAHEAILKKDWSKACDYLDQIVIAAAEGKVYCLGEIKE
mgnify:CR=1 FL=1|jgi:hypothetical protein